MFGKQYPVAAEFNLRFEKFTETDSYIEDYNNRPFGVPNPARTTLAHNKFSDWT